MISRTLVIVLALIAAGMRASQGAWVASLGLAALAAGLVCLRTGDARPEVRSRFRLAAWVCFAITAAAMAIVFYQQYS